MAVENLVSKDPAYQAKIDEVILAQYKPVDMQAGLTAAQKFLTIRGVYAPDDRIRQALVDTDMGSVIIKSNSPLLAATSVERQVRDLFEVFDEPTPQLVPQTVAPLTPDTRPHPLKRLLSTIAASPFITHL